MNDNNGSQKDSKHEMDAQDDLLDDLMNIVQNDENPKTAASQPDQIEKCESQHQKPGTNGHECEEEDANYEEFDENSGDEFDELNEEHDDFVDQMLEKPIDILEEKDECNFYTYDKIQIKNIYWRGCQGTILPEGWVQVTHACGMPMFLNRQTRVCTLSRPYYINEDSARKHDIPISAIPCMAYKRRKEIVEGQIREHNLAKAEQKNSRACPMAKTTQDTPTQKTTEQVTEHGTNAIAAANQSAEDTAKNETTDKVVINKNNKKIVVSIQTNEEKSKENIMTPEQVHEYCKGLFEFDIIKVKKFKTWGDRKTFIRQSKQKNNSKFPENAKMLKIETKTQKGISKELNINMTNKSALSILYEYASQVHKSNPRFEITEKENPKDPYHAVCYIADKISGKGTGNSKKLAKTAAAEAALSVLIPDFKAQCSDNTDVVKNNDDASTFFDDFPVEHSHIYLHSQKLGSPLPYDVLLTCLKYNYAINMNRNQKQVIDESIKPIKYRNCLYKMKLGQYEAEVNCTKKKEGRQFAAQKILKEMHPHITTWGSMLRLYCAKMTEALLYNDDPNKVTNPSSYKTTDPVQKSKQQQAQEQETSKKAKPNKELLEKLKEEMRKLKRPSQTRANINGNGAAVKDTLLTIPPLELANELGSGFLVANGTEPIKLDADSASTLSSENDGKIMFSVDSGKTRGEEYGELGSSTAKKRRINNGSESREFYEHVGETDKMSDGEDRGESGGEDEDFLDKTSDDEEGEEEEGELTSD